MKYIDFIWSNIKDNEGETFQTVRGVPFTYAVKGNEILPYRDGKYVGRPLSKKNFEKALLFAEYSSKNFTNSIMGPSYVRAILEDRRIK